MGRVRDKCLRRRSNDWRADAIAGSPDAQRNDAVGHGAPMRATGETFSHAH
jgi:hypothetical protein